ncbi:transcriptional regulator [Bacillus phage Pascal]|uniref:Transcriptional regulator n=1 Tax=Bacillus phage Pascal TaxID=1540092 RepID=A0A0A0RNS5_9CAUD|nr:transcriptional regulator [Bacillus phage Pascal]AIW03677.1 transcriptional regulator [Bacillus phage Pascal]
MILNKTEKKAARATVSNLMNLACERCVTPKACDSCPIRATMQSMYGLVEGDVNWKKNAVGITAQKYRKLRHRNFNDSEIVQMFDITPKELLDFKRKEKLISSRFENDDDIREIRRLRNVEKWTYSAIAKKYGCSSMTASEIARGVRFSEVE